MNGQINAEIASHDGGLLCIARPERLRFSLKEAGLPPKRQACVLTSSSSHEAAPPLARYLPSST